ncbi:MAG: hypothetical protein HC783_11560 [Rhodobacteraceae bacterium]|nr:hypothetical protein [Paracoccaceae bacterium]
MAEKIVWMLEEANMTISPPLSGQQAGLCLDGQSQGNDTNIQREIAPEGVPVEIHAPWLKQAPLPLALRDKLLFSAIFEVPGDTAPARPFLTVGEGRIFAPYGAGGGT